MRWACSHGRDRGSASSRTNARTPAHAPSGCRHPTHDRVGAPFGSPRPPGPSVGRLHPVMCPDGGHRKERSPESARYAPRRRPRSHLPQSVRTWPPLRARASESS
ncbi:hypothetical protein B005_4004 [Nocardiopsis alba ATCC BAA-2165]|uniref:Uncharacterized protein n=1 Tax=Nocardiopsis alba (strain ATCC BAA-2165 / BE74) TaxID=1205910 RepID=J7L055_NOCAA|nr:hypothetical protein B005_4004 [Nocardiopsis alba ATCC BAA-2165]